MFFDGLRLYYHALGVCMPPVVLVVMSAMLCEILAFRVRFNTNDFLRAFYFILKQLKKIFNRAIMCKKSGTLLMYNVYIFWRWYGFVF